MSLSLPEKTSGTLHCLFRLSGGKLKSFTPEPEKEIWPGLFTPSLALTSGTAGKSFLVLQQALAVAIGGAPSRFAINKITRPQPVLMALGCDSLAVIDERINRIADIWELDFEKRRLAANNLRIIDCSERPDILDSDFRRALELGAEGIGNCPPGMVVLDPLHHFVNLWNPEELSRSVKVLKSMAQDLRCVIMAIGRDMPDCRYIQELYPIKLEDARKLSAFCGLDSRRIAQNCVRLSVKSCYAGHMPDNLLLRAAGGVLLPLNHIEAHSGIEGNEIA